MALLSPVRAAFRRPAAGDVSLPGGPGSGLLLPSLTTVVLVLGAVLRIREWSFNKSLWLDEFSIADSIDHRGYLGLTHPLAHAQAAPLGWLWAERTSVNLFGISEESLRLVPLAASLIGLGLFCKLAYRVLGDKIGLIALALFATSPALIYFSAETKQYSSDVTFGLFVMCLTIWVVSEPVTLRRGLLWGAGTAISLWFSQPSVLVSAAAGIVVLWVVRHSRQQLRAVAFGGAVLAASLVIDYVLFLRSQQASNLLQTYWKAGYPSSVLPTTWLSWLHRQLTSILSDPGHLHATGLALILLAAGAWVLVRQRQVPAALVLLPFAIGVAVASAHVYPLAQRLALYLLPGIYVVMAAALGVQSSFGVTRNLVGRTVLTSAVGVALILTAAPGAWRGISVLFTPFDRTNGRGAVAFVASHFEAGDLIITEKPWGEPNFDFYGRRKGLHLGGRFSFVPTTAGGCPSDPLQGLPTERRVWIVLAHTFSGAPVDRAAIYESQFERAGAVTLQWHGAGGAAAFLIQRGQPPPADAGRRAPWVSSTCLHVQRL